MKKSDKKRKTKKTRKTSQPRHESKIASKANSNLMNIGQELGPARYQAALKKTPEKRLEGKGSLSKYIHVAVQFFREARTELKKVKWPTRKELFATTVMVIVLVLIVALFLGIIDFGLIKIIKRIVG